MSANSVVGLPERRNAFLPIAVGGSSAGILDLTHDLLLGISVHLFTVGLPISFSVRRFAK